MAKIIKNATQAEIDEAVIEAGGPRSASDMIHALNGTLSALLGLHNPGMGMDCKGALNAVTEAIEMISMAYAKRLMAGGFDARRAEEVLNSKKIAASHGVTEMTEDDYKSLLRRKGFLPVTEPEWPVKEVKSDMPW